MVEVWETMAARGLVNGRGPRSGRDSVLKTAGILMQLSDELHRLLDQRMHISVVIDERHNLAITCENLLDRP